MKQKKNNKIGKKSSSDNLFVIGTSSENSKVSVPSE